MTAVVARRLPARRLGRILHAQPAGHGAGVLGGAGGTGIGPGRGAVDRLPLPGRTVGRTPRGLLGRAVADQLLPGRGTFRRSTWRGLLPAGRGLLRWLLPRPRLAGELLPRGSRLLGGRVGRPRCAGDRGLRAGCLDGWVVLVGGAALPGLGGGAPAVRAGGGAPLGGLPPARAGGSP